MSDLRYIISGNIVQLRKAKKLTQLALANELNYSDKAISKWERGESTPDISILKQIADFFDVTVDYLLVPHSNEEMDAISEERDEVKRNILTLNDVSEINDIELQDVNQKKNKIDKKMLTILSTSPAWLIATIIFILVAIFTGKYLWSALYICVPVTILLILIFNSIWGNQKKNYFIVSCLVWSILICLFLLFIDDNIWQILLLGIPAQIIIIIWSKLKK